MIVESAEGVELLLDAGIERRITGSADVEIRSEDGDWTRWQVKVLHHSPSPTEVERALKTLTRHGHDGVLFVVARAGTGLADAARDDTRVAFAALKDRTVSFQGRLHHAAPGVSSFVPHRGRTSWVRLGALRLFALLDNERPLTQTAIAHRLGVSHVAVGKQLPQLGDPIERTRDGWRALDRRACWDRFIADYPGPRGLATYWTSTSDVSDQLARLVEATRDDSTDELILSGDLAADRYAPWRRPSRITAYLTWQPALERHGFASVRADEATLELRIPKDPTISAMARRGGNRADLRYADPLIAAWDLARTPGGDVPDSVDHLRDRVLTDHLWS
ncbi:MAG: hypothetical protein R2717_01525 [Schumannella sp.]|nr:hypothetical protein [Microbacteriaceae bacterium]